MAKHNPNQSLADAFDRIERVRSLVARHGFGAIRADVTLCDALLHNLLLASEAITRLKNRWPEQYARVESTHPDVDWRAFRVLGDRIRHGYDIIDMAIIGEIVDSRVPAIKSAIQSELAFTRIDPFNAQACGIDEIVRDITTAQGPISADDIAEADCRLDDARVRAERRQNLRSSH